MGHFLATYLKVLVVVWALIFFGGVWLSAFPYLIALVITVCVRAYLAQEERISSLEEQLSDVKRRLKTLEKEISE